MSGVELLLWVIVQEGQDEVILLSPKMLPWLFLGGIEGSTESLVVVAKIQTGCCPSKIQTCYSKANHCILPHFNIYELYLGGYLTYFCLAFLLVQVLATFVDHCMLPSLWQEAVFSSRLHDISKNI